MQCFKTTPSFPAITRAETLGTQARSLWKTNSQQKGKTLSSSEQKIPNIVVMFKI